MRTILITGTVLGFLGAGIVTVTPVRAAGPAIAATQSQPADQQSKFQNSAGNNVDPVSGKVVKNTSVVDYINSAYNWAAIIGGLLAVMMIMYAGFTYMTSAGDPEKSSNAKDMIEKALIGLGLLIMAAVILRTINVRTIEPCNPNSPNCGDVNFSTVNGGQPGQGH